MDPPGQAKPDWWIVAQVAQRMGFEGFEWKDSDEVFEEASERSRGTVHDYSELVALGRLQGKRGHEAPAEWSTTGIQCPIQRTESRLFGTKRIHDDGFGTISGKAFFVNGDWNEVSPFQEQFVPNGDELWVTQHAGQRALAVAI